MINGCDMKWLQCAASLAERGRGRVRPNPMVGCVLVKEERLVGQGWHADYGGPHAEVAAIESATESVRGSTAYVTLEPCNHQGITPPCSEYLIKKGIRKLFYGAAEPTEMARGGGDRLKDSGLDVYGPMNDFQISEGVDPAFFFTSKHERTYLALKLAISADDMIASKRGGRTFLTGDESNKEVHRLRSGFDAIVIGSNTARIDDPLLTVRGLPHAPRIQPTKVILSSDGNVSPGSRLFDSIDTTPVLVIVTKAASPDRVTALKYSGARVETLSSLDDKIDLKEAMKLMWDLGLKSVLCEGGAQLSEAFCRNNLAQRVYLFRNPVVLGPEAVPSYPAETAPWYSTKWSPRGDSRNFGRDKFTIYDREI